MNAAVNLNIPAESWEETGDADTGGTDSRLLATVVIGGCHFHADAICVVDNEDGDQEAVGLYDDILDNIRNVDGDGGSFQTTTINGKEYVIVIYPYQR